MSWLRNLYETYEYAMKDEARTTKSGDHELLPVAFIVQNAQITVVLDQEGRFVRATLVEKAESPTPIPVTNESAIRTSAPVPHPLFDNLWYLAGDLIRYYKVKSKREDPYNKNFLPYMSQLLLWAKDADTNLWVKVVYDYLNEERLATDLIESGILEMDEHNRFKEKNFGSTVQHKAMVRFAIESEGKLIELWNERKFMESYERYYLNKLQSLETSMCYVSGGNLYPTKSHGKYIRYAGDGAKLISANDSSGFTFRGRFADASECVEISYEVSEKAHNALKWLVRKQGYVRNGYVVLSWSNKLNDIPQPMVDTPIFYQQVSYVSNTLVKAEVDTNQAFAEALNKSIRGFKAKLDANSQVTIMAMDNATPGRLAILYYQNMNISDYLERLEHWHTTAAWVHRYKKDESGKYEAFQGAPTPDDIVNVAFGNEQNDFLKVDEKLFKQQLERLLPCILEKKRIPIDFVRGAFQNACSPMAKSGYNWAKCVSVACSLAKKYDYDRNGVIWEMTLQRESTDRNYLFGRLLAVADRIEEQANYQKQVDRPTAARRYMDAYSKRPFKTWGQIELALTPYLNILYPGSRNFYKRLLDEIMCLFQEGDFSSRKALDSRFLLGYHCQSQDLWKSNDTQETEQAAEEVK